MIDVFIFFNEIGDKWFLNKSVVSMTASFDQWTHFEVGTWFWELILPYWEVMRCQLDLSITVCFYEILARTYAPGAAALEAWITWGNIQVQHAPRALFECTLLQEHIYACSWSIVHFKYAPGAYWT